MRLNHALRLAGRARGVIEKKRCVGSELRHGPRALAGVQLRDVDDRAARRCDGACPFEQASLGQEGEGLAIAGNEAQSLFRVSGVQRDIGMPASGRGRNGFDRREFVLEEQADAPRLVRPRRENMARNPGRRDIELPVIDAVFSLDNREVVRKSSRGLGEPRADGPARGIPIVIDHPAAPSERFQAPCFLLTTILHIAHGTGNNGPDFQ